MARLLVVLYLLFIQKITSSQNELITNKTVEENSKNISSLAAAYCSKELEDVRASHSDDNISRQKSIQILMAAAVCYHKQNDISQALRFYGEIRESYPDFAFVLINIGMIALRNADINNAIILLEGYLQEVGGMYGESSSTIIDKFAQEYGPICTSVSTSKGDCVDALNVLGSAYLSVKKSEKALPCLKRAIQIGHFLMLREVYFNYACHLADMGDHLGASEAYIKSFWISVKNGNGEINPAPLIKRAILVPVISKSLDQATQVRIKFEQQVRDLIALAKYGGAAWIDDTSNLFRVSDGISKIEDIRSLPPLANSLTHWTEGIQTPHFHLHYYGFHDRPIQELVAEMYALICTPSLFEVTPYLSEYQLSDLVLLPENAPIVPNFVASSVLTSVDYPNKKEKLRIAFISSHFGGDEPHGLLLIDVIRNLPRRLFDVAAIIVGPVQPSKDFIDAVSGNWYSVGYSTVLTYQILNSLRLDCLVFAEMQNEALVHFLGYQRWAPCQILVMGAPVTSGNPCIDYFISGDRLEHPFRTQLTTSMEPYTEQIVLFDGQGISFPKETKVRTIASHEPLNTTHIASTLPLDEFGIPILSASSNYSIYMCYQSLYKVQPSFDYILAEILHADPEGYIILQSAILPMRTLIISQRIKSIFIEYFCTNPIKYCTAAREAFSRIFFIPRVPSDQVGQILQRSTVILHPFPFGGSKTSSDALREGIPLVTYPQPYLRGRMAESFYTTLELHTVDPEVAAHLCCVANSVSDYVAKTLRLGKDKSYREKVSIAIKKRSHRIWDDRQTSFEWARFLTRALGVVISFDELVFEMNYKPQSWQEDEIVSGEMEINQFRWKKSLMLQRQSKRSL